MAQGTTVSQVNTGGNPNPNQGQNGQQQQQIQLQQNTATTAIHGQGGQSQQQHHHQGQATNQGLPTQLQVIQQPLQGQYSIQQLYNSAQGHQLLMNGNIIHHPGLNQGGIQVINDLLFHTIT